MSPKLIASLRKSVTEVQSGLLYTSLIITMAIVSFCFLVYEWLPGADSKIVGIGASIDLTVAYIFIIDFCFGLFFNTEFKGRKDYLKKNWPDLISSAPITSEVTQVLRLLRIWRALRVLRVAIRIWNAKKQASAFKDFLTK
jgi:Ion transport protein